MKEYNVTMPFAGTMSIIVEAETEEEAKEKFYEQVNRTDISLHFNDIDKIGAETEWDFYEKLLEGNFCYVWNTRMEIEEC